MADTLKPKIVYRVLQQFFFLLLRTILLLLVSFERVFYLKKSREVRKLRPSLIALEAGLKGWDLIEYKELYQSATEYLGVNAVQKVVVATPDSYFKDVTNQIGDLPVTHYFYDPRTGPQSFWRGTTSALKLSVYLTRRHITPVVRLTDVPNRFWRFLTLIVNASGGICITLMCPIDIHYLFPHKRIYGPFMMPFSYKTFSQVKQERSQSLSIQNSSYVQFVGSLYEPRTSFLKNLDKGLRHSSIELRMRTRSLGEDRISDQDYWSTLVNAGVNVTTSDQVTGKGFDDLETPHLIYRYTEVLVSGSALVATYAPGSWKYFTPGIDYADFKNLDEAQERIVSLIDSNERREKLAYSGHTKAESLIRSSTFWRSIDITLGIDGFLVSSDFAEY
jgi:hypothetical protein